MDRRGVARRLAAIGVLLLFAGVAMRGLGGLLLGMHKSGGDPHRWSSLAPLRTDPRDLTENARGVIEGWQQYAKLESPGFANAWEVVQWAMAFDIVLFAPLYAWGLITLMAYVRDRAGEWRQPRATPSALAEQATRSGYSARRTLPAQVRAAQLGIAAVAVAFFADECENGLTLLVTGLGWHDNDDWRLFAIATLALWAFAWVKWVLVSLAVVIAALLLLLLAFGGVASPSGGWNEFRRRLRTVRLHLILVGFASVLLFAHEQIPDLVRRWDPIALTVTALLALWFALLVWLSTRRLLTVERWNPTRDAAADDRLERRLLSALTVLAALQLGVHLFAHGEWDPGWGLVVPWAILAASALAGRALPDPGPTPRPNPYAAPPIVLPPPPEAGGERERLLGPRLPRFLASLTVIAFALGVWDASLAYAVYVHRLTWDVVWIPAGMLVLSLLGPWLARIARRRVHPVFWAVTGAVAGVLALGAKHGDLHEQLQPPVIAVAAVLLALLGWWLYEGLAYVRRPNPKRLARPLLGVAAGVVLLVGAGVIAFPVWIGEQISALGVLYAFLITSLLAASLLTWAGPGLPVPRLYRTMHVTTFPLLALVALWFVLASSFDPGGFHDARIRKQTEAAATGVTLEQAFACWLRKNGLASASKCDRTQPSDLPPTRADGGATPLILVATTGGGIRAAYWTALALDCAFERTAPVAEGRPVVCGREQPSSGFAGSNRLFALSGISGGSVGLVSYAAQLIDKRAARAPNPDWVRDALHVDALSGAGAWWLFVELPRVFLQFDVPKDRAVVQEQGWQERWEDGELARGLFDVWRREPQVPLLLLNGTSVTDGCRFNVSVLDGNVERTVEPIEGEPGETAEAKATFTSCRSTDPFDDSAAGTSDEPAGLESTRVAPESVLPGTRDLVDYLCKGHFDMPLSTAGLLSGRFPIVNSSGRIPRQCETKKFKRPVAFVVDGGYLDTSGASPIFELMQALGPLIEEWNRDPAHRGGCIVPLMIQIDNGFDAGAARSKRPKELFVPPKTLAASRLGRAGEARAGAALLFDSIGSSAAGPVNRYAHFVNQVHAGPHAPLGWAQSEFSEQELESQLDKPQNQQALKEVRRWLEPGRLGCER